MGNFWKLWKKRWSPSRWEVCHRLSR